VCVILALLQTLQIVERAMAAVIAPTNGVHRHCLTGRKAVGSCQSRSTSAGSTARPESILGEQSSYACDDEIFKCLGMSTFPHANTVLDSQLGRQMALDSFRSEWPIQSCPVSRVASLDGVGPPPGLEDFAAAAPANEALYSTLPSTVQERLVQSAPASFDEECLPSGLLHCIDELHPEHLDLASAACAHYSWEMPPCPPLHPAMQPHMSAVFREASVLCLSQALQPQWCSAQCPTAGSIGHWSGECKPCAFFHTKGCATGIACTFCHLCGPDEKKHRKLNKKEQRRVNRY